MINLRKQPYALSGKDSGNNFLKVKFLFEVRALEIERRSNFEKQIILFLIFCNSSTGIFRPPYLKDLYNRT